MTDETKPAAPDQDKLYGTGMVGHIRDTIQERNEELPDTELHITDNQIDVLTERIFLKLVREGWAFGSYR